MNWLFNFYLAIDPYLIFFFRLIKIPILGFYLGNFVLAFVATLIGEITMVIIYRANKSYFDSLNREMLDNHSLSIRAIMVKSKKHFKAANTLANEAFGKAFFASLALFASSLWPVPFALGWLGFRFSGIDFPLPFINFNVGYSSVFIPIYILSRMLFGKIKPYFSFFKIGEDVKEEKEFLSWSDLHKK